MPAAKPITIEPIGPTKPHAGVITTSPAIAPDTAPSIDGLPLSVHSTKVHATVAAHVASSVVTKASAAAPFASRFEPTLNPNQPTHNSEPPTIVNVRLCGAIVSRP